MLNVSTQSSRKPRKEQLTEDEQPTTQNFSEDSKSPERNKSGVQTPEKGEKLALNAQSMFSSGIQTPVRDQTPTSADNNSLKNASQHTSIGNKPAATKVEEYKAKMPYPPYPQKLRQVELDKQFARFADYLRTLEIKIPFAEALEPIPSYAKFMKEILSHKKD